MAKPKKPAVPPLLDLGKRERQIMEAIYRRGAATVNDVVEELDDPPSYSAVRTMIGKLEEKGLLRHEIDGPRYVYKAVVPIEKARASVVNRMVENLFGGSAIQAMSSLLDASAGSLGRDELDALEELIRKRRKDP